jgi:hypothetical protein
LVDAVAEIAAGVVDVAVAVLVAAVAVAAVAGLAAGFPVNSQPDGSEQLLEQIDYALHAPSRYRPRQRGKPGRALQPTGVLTRPEDFLE